MAEIHVNAAAAVSGDGSQASPFITIQEAINVANGSDEIMLWNNATHNVTTPLDFSSGFGASLGSNGYSPLKIRSFIAGSALVITPSARSGQLGAHVSGGGVCPRFTSQDRISYSGIKLSGFTEECLKASADSVANSCEISGTETLVWGIDLDQYSSVTNCWVDVPNAVKGGIRLDNNSFLYGNVVLLSGGNQDTLGWNIGNTATAANNVIKCTTPAPKRLCNHSYRNWTFNNTFIGGGFDNQSAIDPDSYGQVYMPSNLFHGFSGNNSKGIDFSPSDILFTGYNAFFNCSEPYDSGISNRDYAGKFVDKDVYETSDPLVDVANNDFRLKPDSLAAQLGMGAK